MCIRDRSWGQSNLNAGDTILLTEMEHHSNLVPWQILAKRIGAKLEFIPVTGDNGLLDLSDIDARLDRAKLLSFTHFSNTMGTINPAKELCQMARKAGVVSLVDAAQSAGHTLIDVQEIDCDFLAFSGHKICGPTGIGVLYGRKEKLEEMPPYQGGGEMISKVEYFESTFNEIPHKFEAGTPNIAGAAGLYAAIDYIEIFTKKKKYLVHSSMNKTEEKLPNDIEESLDELEESKNLREAFGEDVINSYLKLQRKEIQDFDQNDTFDKKSYV